MRWGRLAVVPALLAAIAAGALLAFAHGSDKADQNVRVDDRVAALLAGIPQRGRTLGSALAPVTLQVFGDLEDEDSRRWVLDYLPAIVKELVRPGVLKIEYRSFKTNTLDPATFVRQQTAALAAGAQDKLWDYIEIFYGEQGREYSEYVTESYIDGIARQVRGLDNARWRRDRNDGRRSEQVVADDQAAGADGIHTSPGYRLGRTGDRLHDFAGSDAITFPHQKYPTTWVSAEDLAKAIQKLH